MSVMRTDRESLGALSYKAVKDAEAKKKTAENPVPDAPEATEEEKKTAEDLAAYKKTFLAKIESMVASPILSNTQVKVKITDDGYARMMNDSEYEKKVIDLFRKETLANYGSGSTTISLTADGESESATASADASGSLSASETFSNLSPLQLRRGAGLEALNLKVMSVIQSRLGSDSSLLEGLDDGTVIQGGSGKTSSPFDSFRTQSLASLLDARA
ncbi:MAG: hypothetical protein LBS30_03830 [Planctomycetota bacterium]|jgi:hypothetical protein|nr:hypothetical protein [Planctomycetota bacterium]